MGEPYEQHVWLLPLLLIALCHTASSGSSNLNLSVSVVVNGTAWPMGGYDTRRSGQSPYAGTQQEYLAGTYLAGGSSFGGSRH